MSGPLIRSKAMDIAQQLEYKHFSASSGWLERFKNRHNITFRTISGESASVSVAVVDDFKTKLPALINNYNPRDVYNADETGLFFRALPDKTLALKGEKCAGGKMSKERLTILFCANMAGHSEKPLVIGKAARPRAFQKINLNTLPVVWRFNKKSWMTCEIMTEFLREFDKKMGLEKRKILLFLDNAASHPRDLILKNIKIVFLPPNTTAICQPLDQGIIKNFKTWYRSIILKHILAKMDSVNYVQDLTKTINLLDVIYFIKKAWNQVTPVTIENCFRKAGFTYSQDFRTDLDFDPEDELPLSTIAEMCKMLHQSGANNIDFDAYTNVDNNLVHEDVNVEISIDIGGISQREESDSDEEMVDNDEESTIKTYKDALSILDNIKVFTSRNNDTAGFELVSELKQHFEGMVLKIRNVHQTTILDFFSPSQLSVK